MTYIQNISHFSKVATWKNIQDFNMINNFISLNSLQFSFFSHWSQSGKKIVKLNICDLEFLGLFICKGVFPLLIRADSHGDFDESELGKWPSSKSEHLDSARADRFLIHT